MRRLASACVAALAVLVVPAVAPGGLSITAPTAVTTSVTLDGFDETATFNVALTVGGPGTGGWHITAWAPRPAAGSSSLGALVVPSQPVTACSGAGCVKAASSLTWPITLGTTSGGAVKIFNAARSTGTGSSDTVTVPVSTSVPANTLHGSYTTTITVAISSGP